MPRIAIPKREDTPEASKPIVDNVAKMLGFVPNLHRLMSVSPNALSGWAILMGSLAKTLDVKTRDGIALAVSEADGGDYCLAAHSFTAGNHAKIPADEIELNREGRSSDLEPTIITDITPENPAFYEEYFCARGVDVPRARRRGRHCPRQRLPIRSRRHDHDHRHRARKADRKRDPVRHGVHQRADLDCTGYFPSAASRAQATWDATLLRTRYGRNPLNKKPIRVA